jgi:hypothetical protein
MVALIDLHGATVRILDKRAAAPRTLCVLSEDPRVQAPNRVHRTVERFDIEPDEGAARFPQFGEATRGVACAAKDREMDTLKVHSEMFGTIAVVFHLQRDAESSVEGSGSFSIAREEHDRRHRNHPIESATDLRSRGRPRRTRRRVRPE